MPADALWLEVGKRRSAIALGELLALKLVFGVSIQALTHRCRDLRIIGQATYRSLFNEFDRLGWRSPPYEEYGAFLGEQLNRFNRLCLRALAEGAINESKAAELLNIAVADVDLHMQATPRPLRQRSNQVLRRVVVSDPPRPRPRAERQVRVAPGAGENGGARVGHARTKLDRLVLAYSKAEGHRSARTAPALPSAR